MKMRILSSQLQELTPEQQEKLRKWWKPQEGDWWKPISSDEPQLLADHLKECCHREKCGHDSLEDWGAYLGKHCLPLLSIGQMLQLIDESNHFIRYQFIVGRSSKARLPSEFCDELWQAVKEIL